MHSRHDPSPELLRLIHQQAAVVTREQATALGLGARSQQRLVDHGHWQRLAPGVLLTNSAPVGWMSLAWAGVLRGGDSARVAGAAAAYLHKLVDDPPSSVLVLLPHGTHRISEEPWIFSRERPGVRARSVGSLPRTGIDDTVLDLCEGAFLARAGNSVIGSVDGWISDAVQRRLTTPKRLRRALNRRTRLAGRREILGVLDAVSDGAQSVLELDYLRDVERAHGLPRGTRQAPALQGGRRIYRDVRYRQYGLLVELDGHRGHVGVDRFRDFRRDNDALLRGEVTLRYGRVDVQAEPCAIARQVAEVLIRGGWTGMITRCPRCPTGFG
ncbi:MAG TPA: type IV toxin-antitoxin system AbiEi family antitoxin domain-containing protein [Microlunatus sp.]